MDFVQIIEQKNKVKPKRWPELPSAFNEKMMEAVVKGLKDEGWEIYDAKVGDTTVCMARREVIEIYFNNDKAIFIESDYGVAYGKSFDISIVGEFHANRVPEHYWCTL